MAFKWLFRYLLLALIFSAGCTNHKREMQLDKKERDLNEKEQQLVFREQSLDLREKTLFEKEKVLDSTVKKIAGDSLVVNYPDLPGSWNVKMVCTETSCPGSALGDTKNEKWDFTIRDNNVIASAISNNVLVRVYAGTFSNNSIRLTVQQDSSEEEGAKMTVRLQRVTENEMTGEREIIQSSGCRILYSLELKKQTK